MENTELMEDMQSPHQAEHSQIDLVSATEVDLSAVLQQCAPHPEINLDIERFQNNEEMDFFISSRIEILSILKNIAGSKAGIRMHFDNEQNSTPTTLFGVNEQGIWLDAAYFSQECKPLLYGNSATFVTSHQNVKIQFVTRNIGFCSLGSKEVFYAGLPTELLRIQRREFFRSAIPPANHLKCLIPIQTNPDTPATLLSAPLIDISGGGIRLLCEEDDDTFLPNKTFQNCQISLPEAGILTLSIEVRNSISISSQNDFAHKRIGCRFVRPNNQINILLQRHITRLQGESMSKRHFAEFF